jgi:hypothetical protein
MSRLNKVAASEMGFYGEIVQGKILGLQKEVWKDGKQVLSFGNWTTQQANMDTVARCVIEMLSAMDEIKERLDKFAEYRKVDGEYFVKLLGE